MGKKIVIQMWLTLVAISSWSVAGFCSASESPTVPYVMEGGFINEELGQRVTLECMEQKTLFTGAVRCERYNFILKWDHDGFEETLAENLSFDFNDDYFRSKRLEITRNRYNPTQFTRAGLEMIAGGAFEPGVAMLGILWLPIGIGIDLLSVPVKGALGISEEGRLNRLAYQAFSRLITRYTATPGGPERLFEIKVSSAVYDRIITIIKEGRLMRCRKWDQSGDCLRPAPYRRSASKYPFKKVRDDRSAETLSN